MQGDQEDFKYYMCSEHAIVIVLFLSILDKKVSSLCVRVCRRKQEKRKKEKEGYRSFYTLSTAGVALGPFDPLVFEST